MSAAAHSDTPVAVSTGTVKSVYAHLDCLVEGIDALKRAGIRDIVVTAPLPRHEIEEMLYEGRPSPVRWFTLVGALFGGIFGFSLCSMTHLNWAMIMPAGKPLVSIPPFLVITFESTVLWGCLFTLAGMMWLSRLPSHDLQVEATDPRFSDDVFGLIVNNLGKKQAAKVVEMLSVSGAIEVENGYDGKPVAPAPEAPVIAPGAVASEPDDPNTNMLIKITIAATVIILVSVIGVSIFFQESVAGLLNDAGYSYSTTEQAVAPDNRPNK
jgi:hypothetical protein